MEQLEKIQSYLGAELKEMNQIISSTLDTPNELMNSIVSSYLEKKGKQIRPILVILSAKLFGSVNEDVLQAGAALEMLHNASLIHDDIVDETSLRRGLPTINATWGNHIAVLVGDYFVSNALVAGIKTGHLTIISALSALGKELSLGEIDQICNVREHHFDEQSYFMMIRKKTASLFMNCVKMGAEAAGATSDEYSPMVQYAELLGLCFQIKDDIFDYFADAAIGKPTGNDLREGKITLPLLHVLRDEAIEGCAGMRSLARKEALGSDEIASLINFAIENGGIDYAYATMARLRNQAAALLRDTFAPSPTRDALISLIDFIIERNH